jgi:hypothetical protein
MAKRKRKKKSAGDKQDDEQGRRFLVTVGIFAMLLIVGIFIVRAIFGG